MSLDPRRWEEIQTSFDQIVELDAHERAGRLAVLGSSDPELRRALESLLAADTEASEKLAPIERGVFSRSEAQLDPLGLTGRTITHFEVRELLGVGGMGAVYAGEDTRLGRAVALKFLLPPYYLDEGAKARFLREAHSAGALDHPNLCSIHEIGTSEDGRLFLAMPLCRGETLKARLAREGPLLVDRALDIARQVAEGLKAAHALGIVHRDLKPANIMLLPDGMVKILDFGLAKVRDQSLSETGARFGTVSYMAPEQIRGAAVDGRADLWALGVVLYEMLTARKPFAANEEVAVAHAILHDDPKIPSTYRPDLSDTIEDLVLRLLQKDPTRRFADCAELLPELGKVRTLATAPHPTRRRLRAVRRALGGRGGRIVGRAVAALLLLSVAGYTAIARNDVSAAAPSRMAIAVLPFRNLSADGPNAFFAGGLHDEILNQLYKIPELRVIGRSSVMSYGGVNASPIREIARELGVGSVVEGSVQVVGNRVRVNVQLSDPSADAPLWVDRYDRALDDAFAIQSDIAQQIVATLGASLTSAQRTEVTSIPTEKTEAYLLYLRGRDHERRPGLLQSNLDAARQLYDRALALDPNFAQVHASLSTIHGHMYWLRYDMTAERLTRARQAAVAALRLAPDLAEAHIAMAHVHNVGPDTDIRAGLEELHAAARSHPNDAQVWRWIAQGHRRLGEWEKFEEPFANAVRLDPRNVDLLWDQGGGTYSRMGRHAESIYWYDRALRVAPDFSNAMLAKAWVYVTYQRGQLDTVRAVLDRLAERTELSASESVTGHRARLLYFERRPDSLLRVLAASRVPVVQSVTGYTPVQLWAAWAHELRGDRVAARAAFDSALVVLDSAIRKFPEDWPVHAGRGFALAGLGRRGDALAEVRWLQECWIYRKDAYLRSSVSASIAKILTRAGETSAALDRVEQLISERPPGISVHFLQLDPIWDPIREHPRFRAILTRHRR